MTVGGEGCCPFLAPLVMTSRAAISRWLSSWSRRCGRHVEHVVVGDARAADPLPPQTSRLVPLQRPVADVLALHARHRGEHGEDDAARVMAALEVAGEELQADAARARGLGVRQPARFSLTHWRRSVTGIAWRAL
jgi:hypothetical protein